MRALALFSGGLDSSIAIHVVKSQGIEVIAINFESYFFGGASKRLKKSAKELGVQLEIIDFKEAQKEIVHTPPSGYGKNMNPCIDCHALMMKIAKELLIKYDAQFIISGEVLGQRPMSQNSVALRRVEKYGDVKGLIVRPLSAQLMAPTEPEIKGWIDRNQLLKIQGRGRKDQMAYAEAHNLKEFPSPGGGCLLTEQNFSKRLKVLKDDDQFNEVYLFELIKKARIARIAKGRYLLIGRLKDENEFIFQYKDHGYFVKGGETPGPAILFTGDPSAEEKQLIFDIFSLYSKVKGLEKAVIRENGVLKEIDSIDVEATQEKLKAILIA